MGVSTKSRCTTYSFQPASHRCESRAEEVVLPLGVPAEPSVWPRSGRIAESLLGGDRRRDDRLLPHQLLARWRDADSVPAVDLVGKPEHRCRPLSNRRM
jgi:hypothetical protein